MGVQVPPRAPNERRFMIIRKFEDGMAPKGMWRIVVQDTSVGQFSVYGDENTFKQAKDKAKSLGVSGTLAYIHDTEGKIRKIYGLQDLKDEYEEIVY